MDHLETTMQQGCYLLNKCCIAVPLSQGTEKSFHCLGARCLTAQLCDEYYQWHVPSRQTPEGIWKWWGSMSLLLEWVVYTRVGANVLMYSYLLYSSTVFQVFACTQYSCTHSEKYLYSYSSTLTKNLYFWVLYEYI